MMTRSGNIEKSKWIGVGLREGWTEDERKESSMWKKGKGDATRGVKGSKKSKMNPKPKAGKMRGKR